MAKKQPETLTLFPKTVFARKAGAEDTLSVPGTVSVIVEIQAPNLLTDNVKVMLTRDQALGLLGDLKRQDHLENPQRALITDRRKRRIEVMKHAEEVMKRLHAAVDAGDDELARTTFLELSEASIEFAGTYEGNL